MGVEIKRRLNRLPNCGTSRASRVFSLQYFMASPLNRKIRTDSNLKVTIFLKKIKKKRFIPQD